MVQSEIEASESAGVSSRATRPIEWSAFLAGADPRWKKRTPGNDGGQKIQGRKMNRAAAIGGDGKAVREAMKVREG
jgi:hypothetical protein